MDQILEPNSGNFYKPHYLMIHSGQFWRCKHGNTGYDKGCAFIGCKECFEELSIDEANTIKTEMENIPPYK